VQIHGGMGYVEETGAAQYFRDARILTIYEGTTGIQAGDLVGRKILRDQGTALTALLAEMDATVATCKQSADDLAVIAAALHEAVGNARTALTWLLEHNAANPANPGAVSYHFLMLLGTVTGGWQMARAALAAQAQLDAGAADTDFYAGKLQTARFYAEQVLPRAFAHARSIESGSATMLRFTLEQMRGE